MRLSPRWLLAVACVVVLLYAYPGYLDAAGLAQLRLVEHGGLSPDAPGFSLLWRIAQLFVAGPFALVLAQAALFTYGARALLRGNERATALLLVMPPVLVGLSTVSPSALTAALLLAAVGTERPTVRRIVLLLAVACTPLAALAAVPLLLLREKRTTALVIGGALLALGVALMFVTLDADRARTELAGMNVPVEVPALDIVEPYAHRAEIVKQRDDVRRAQPGDYAAERAGIFARVLTSPGTSQRSPEERALALKLGVPTGTSFFHDALAAILGVLAFTPLLWPVLYLLIAVVLLGRERRRPLLVALLASGLVLELTLVLTASGASPAGSLWLATAALVGLFSLREST